MKCRIMRYFIWVFTFRKNTRLWISIYKNWAATWSFQQCGILLSVESDEPVQPLVKLETPNAVRSVA